MERHKKKNHQTQSLNKIFTPESQCDKVPKSQGTLASGTNFVSPSKNNNPDCIQQHDNQNLLFSQSPQLMEGGTHKIPLEQNYQSGQNHSNHSAIQPQIPIPVYHGPNNSHLYQNQNTQKVPFNQIENQNQPLNFFDHSLIGDLYDTTKQVQAKRNEDFVGNMSLNLDQNKNFKLYQQFNKLLRTSKNLNDHVKELLKKKKQLALKLSKLEQDMEPIFHSNHTEQMAYLMKENLTSNQNRRKRSRRSANQIPRNYVCSIQTCDRSYGSEASLIQHIKLKHPDLIYVPVNKREQGQYSISGSHIKKVDHSDYFNDHSDHKSWEKIDASIGQKIPQYNDKGNSVAKIIGNSVNGKGKQNQRYSANADGSDEGIRKIPRKQDNEQSLT